MGLVACGGGQDPAEVVREGVTAELESVKNMDDAAYEEMSSLAGAAGLEEFGIDTKEYLTAYLEGFDYTVDEVTVEGETATATVTLTMKSFTELEAALEAAGEQFAEEALANPDMTEEEVNQRMGELIMDAVKNTPVAPTEPIDVVYELIDNVWTPATSAEDAIAKAMLGN